MGNDINSQLIGLGNQKIKIEDLEEVAKNGADSVKSELSKVFEFVSNDNSINFSTLDSQKKALEKQLATYDEKIKACEEELDKKDEEIKKGTEEIANLVSSIETKSNTFESNQQAFAKQAIDDVFYEYEQGIIGKDAISSEITKRIKNGSSKLIGAAEIQLLLENLDSKQQEVQTLAESVTPIIDERKVLKRQISALSAASTLISGAISQIGVKETSFTNSDYDSEVPTYSLTKTGKVADLFANTKYNVEANNKIDMSQKDKEEFETETSEYSTHSDNTTKSTKGFIDTYTTTRTTTTVTTITKYPKSYDEKAGNTIDTNDQIKALSENYSTILNDLNASGFTFKEAMFALFDSEKGLFKDSGITYDLSKQKDGKATYSIADPGDGKTAQMYNNLAEQIKSIWGVDAAVNKDSKVATDTKTKQSKNVISNRTIDRTPRSKRSKDPVGFTVGNQEFLFAMDKNSDGKFSDVTEFVGGGDKTWLEDLKSLDLDGDGKLNKEELKNLKVFGVEHNDSGDKHSSKTDLKYQFVSAADMGIEEINLSGLENNVNKSTGKTDINGNELFEDSFSIKMNGQNITATRKDDVDGYINKAYSAAFGTNFEVGYSSEEVSNVVDSAMQTSMSELDSNNAKYTELEAQVNILKNSDKIAQEANAMFQQVLNRISAMENIEIMKAHNKAGALSNYNGWGSLRQEVMNIAQTKGTEIDMEQAKGMWMNDGSLSAQEIFDKCVEMDTKEKEAEEEQKYEKEAWNSIIKCLKSGIKISADEAMNLLKTGRAKTSDDIVKIKQEEANKNPN